MKLSIRWAMIFGILSIIWGTQLLTATFSYISSEKVLIKHAKAIMENITELTMKQSQNYLALAQSAASLSNKLIVDDIVNTDLTKESFLEKYFYNQLAIYPHFAGIYFATPDGEFFYVSRNDDRSKNGFRTKIIRYNDDGEKKTKYIWRDQNMTKLLSETVKNDLYNPCIRPWYRLAIQKKGITWTNPYIFFTSKKPGITISGPSYSNNGELIGVVGVDIDIQNLSHFINQLRIGTHGKAFIFNKNGDMVAFPDLNKIKEPDNNEGSYLLSKINFIDDELTRAAFNSRQWKTDTSDKLILNEPDFTWFEYKNKRYHAMFSSFTGTRWPWIIGVYIPENDYLGELKKNQINSLVITILLSVIVTGAGLYFARLITKPIINLKKEAKAVGRFDILKNYDTRSIFSEIQYTSNAFNKMKKDLYRHENEKSMLEHELVKSERFAIAGQLSTALVHELKSPLQSVKTLLKTFETRYHNNHEFAEDLILMKNVFDHVEYSLKQFEEFNRPALLIKIPSNINHILEKTVTLVQSSLSKNLIEVNLNLDRNLPDIDVSDQHMKQVFLNILNNAIEAISGASTGETGFLNDEEDLTSVGNVTISTDYTGNDIIIRFTDTGPGIPETLLPKPVFDMFVTERRTRGMGLGLAICKTIVQDYKGTIEAHNADENGAVITVCIPVDINQPDP